MIREELVSGMRMAVSKGENLQQSMMSFYNAGYSKEDVEDSARRVYEESNGIVRESKQTNQKDSQKQNKVSSYEEPNKKKNIGLIVLIVILIFLISLLGLSFLFKQQIISFINSSLA